MCCEMSYLYIGLLTQLLYLNYVGFLNKLLNKYGIDPKRATVGNSHRHGPLHIRAVWLVQ